MNDKFNLHRLSHRFHRRIHEQFFIVETYLLQADNNCIQSKFYEVAFSARVVYHTVLVSKTYYRR